MRGYGWKGVSVGYIVHGGGILSARIEWELGVFFFSFHDYYSFRDYMIRNANMGGFFLWSFVYSLSACACARLGIWIFLGDVPLGV